MIESILSVSMITSKFFFDFDSGKGRKLTHYDTKNDTSCSDVFAKYFCANSPLKTNQFSGRWIIELSLAFLRGSFVC